MSQFYDVPMDVDATMNEEDRHVDEQDVREDEVGVEEGILEDDHIVESDEGELDQLEDKVALEEEELRKDLQASRIYGRRLNGPASATYV